MSSLFLAEWQKLNGHRWLTGFLIWVFPVGVAGLAALGIVVALISPDTVRNDLMDDSATWTDLVLFSWGIPNNLIGRLFLLSYAAVIFAGEYEWGTWKQVVPRTSRERLIIAKFLAFGVLVVAAFVAMSVVIFIGGGIISLLADIPFRPAISGAVLVELAGDYALQVGLAFASTVFVVGLAALAAMLTRSILGGVISGFLAAVFEPGLPILLGFFGGLIDLPGLALVGRFMPTYNVGNINSWVLNDVPRVASYGDASTYSNSLEASIVLMLIWAFGLAALVVGLFRRQDITS